jgi:hypothetical protein
MSLSVAEKLTATSIAVPQASLGVAFRNIVASLSLSILTLALTGWIWREQGYEMLIVAMGWPHVLLGFSFFFGRVLRGERDSRTTLLLLALATLAICVIHYRYSIYFVTRSSFTCRRGRAINTFPKFMRWPVSHR